MRVALSRITMSQSDAEYACKHYCTCIWAQASSAFSVMRAVIAAGKHHCPVWFEHDEFELD